MDSSLSSVPPEKPSPRPLIIGTGTPQAATRGANGSDILSPTPPVECLSTLSPGIPDRSATVPERIIASVYHAVSSAFMPRRKIAINIAASW